MKRLLLACLLACGNASAAEWVLVGERTNTDFYIDALSVEEAGRYRTARILMDLREPQKVFTLPDAYYRSVKHLEYFDCSNSASAVIQASFYAAHMGKGEILEHYSSDQKSASFSKHLPDTLKKKMLEAVCSVTL